jgi:uncharacterized membrane protein YheB (UPF0754 family)
MTRGCESKISKLNLEEIVMDLFSLGWSYQRICNELNEKYFSKNNETISLMAVHRYIQNKRKEFENLVWSGNYETAVISCRDKGMESLNRLGRELILLFEMLYRTKGINASDKRYLERHKEEFLNRIQQVIGNFGYISNSISYKTDAMRQMLLDFTKELDSNGRQKVSELLEDVDWEDRCRLARERCDKMYRNNSEEDKDDGDKKKEAKD